MQISETVIKALIKQWVQDNADFPREESRLVTFNIKGEVSVRQGEDYKQVINHTLPYQELLTLALSKLNGVTIESLMREALEQMENPAFKAECGENKAKATQALTSLKGKAKRNCRGKVTFDSVVGEGDITDCNIC